MFTAIMEIFALIAHLVSTLARIAGPRGVRAVIAESLLLKHQLIVLNRARKRAPRLTRWDRLLFGVGTFLVSAQRVHGELLIKRQSPCGTGRDRALARRGL